MDDNAENWGKVFFPVHNLASYPHLIPMLSTLLLGQLASAAVFHAITAKTATHYYPLHKLSFGLLKSHLICTSAPKQEKLL